MLLTEEDLGTDLYKTLRGQQVGARLLQVSPGSGVGCDGLPDGDGASTCCPPARTASRSRRAPTCPVVTLDASGAPSITPTGTEPPTTLVAQPLIRGTASRWPRATS